MPPVTELLYLERETSLPLPVGEGAISHRDRAGNPQAGGKATSFEWWPFEPALESEFRGLAGDV